MVSSGWGDTAVGARGQYHIYVVGTSLSEPHLMRSMAGSAMFVYLYIYICVCVYMSWYIRPSQFCCLPTASLHSTKMAVACEPFEFSLRRASSEHYYIKRNESSSPATLPIVIDIHCKIGKTSDYCSCPVYLLQCQTSHKTREEGLKHSNRAQIALARQLGSVCAAVFDCSRSCILAATASACPMLSLHPWGKSGS